MGGPGRTPPAEASAATRTKRNAPGKAAAARAAAEPRSTNPVLGDRQPIHHTHSGPGGPSRPGHWCIRAYTPIPRPACYGPAQLARNGMVWCIGCQSPRAGFVLRVGCPLRLAERGPKSPHVGGRALFTGESAAHHGLLIRLGPTWPTCTHTRTHTCNGVFEATLQKLWPCPKKQTTKTSKENIKRNQHVGHRLAWPSPPLVSVRWRSACRPTHLPTPPPTHPPPPPTPQKKHPHPPTHPLWGKNATGSHGISIVVGP